jgi:hypothetical protein
LEEADKITDEKLLIAMSFLAKVQFITTPISQTNTVDKIPNWIRNIVSFFDSLLLNQYYKK